jgi:hypothetical protein
MAPVTCLYVGCVGAEGGVYKTPKDATVEDALQWMAMHIQACHPVAVQQQQQAQVKMEKLDRPKLHLRDGMAEEEHWSFFCHRWKQYKTQANIRTSSVECLASCMEDLAKSIYNKLGDTAYAALTEDTLLRQAKEMIIKKRNKLVNHLKLRKMVQGSDQPVQMYVANIKPIARTGKYTTVCTACQAKHQSSTPRRWCWTR